MKVKLGDKVAEGTLVLPLEASADVAGGGEAGRHSIGAGDTRRRARSGPRALVRRPWVRRRLGRTEEPTAPPPVMLMPAPAEVIVAVVGGRVRTPPVGAPFCARTRRRCCQGQG